VGPDAAVQPADAHGQRQGDGVNPQRNFPETAQRAAPCEGEEGRGRAEGGEARALRRAAALCVELARILVPCAQQRKDQKAAEEGEIGGAPEGHQVQAEQQARAQHHRVPRNAIHAAASRRCARVSRAPAEGAEEALHGGARAQRPRHQQQQRQHHQRVEQGAQAGAHGNPPERGFARVAIAEINGDQRDEQRQAERRVEREKSAVAQRRPQPRLDADAGKADVAGRKGDPQ